MKSLVFRPLTLWSYVPLRTSIQVLRFMQCFVRQCVANEICFLLLVNTYIMQIDEVINRFDPNPIA
jgi:hypothetical protein